MTYDFENREYSDSDVKSLTTEDIGKFLGDILNELKNNSRNKESDVYKNLKHNKDVLTEQLIGRLNGVNDLDIKTKGILLESIESGSGLQNVNLQQIKELLIEQLISSQLTINDVNNWSIRTKGTLLESIESESGSQNVNLQENKKLLIEQLIKEELTDKDVSRWSEQTIEDLLSSIKNELIRTPQNGNLEDNKKVLEIRKEVRNLENTITVTQNSDNIQINLEKATISLKNLAELTGTYQTMIDNESKHTLGIDEPSNGLSIIDNLFRQIGLINVSSEDLTALIKGGQASNGYIAKGMLGDGKGPYDIFYQLAIINKIVKSEIVKNCPDQQSQLYAIKDIYIEKIIDLCLDGRFKDIDISFIQTDDENKSHPYVMVIKLEDVAYPIQVHISKARMEDIKDKYKDKSKNLYIADGIEDVPDITPGLYDITTMYSRNRYSQNFAPEARSNFRIEDVQGIFAEVLEIPYPIEGKFKLKEGENKYVRALRWYEDRLVSEERRLGSTKRYFYSKINRGDEYIKIAEYLATKYNVDRGTMLLELIPEKYIDQLRDEDGQIKDEEKIKDMIKEHRYSPKIAGDRLKSKLKNLGINLRNRDKEEINNKFKVLPDDVYVVIDPGEKICTDVMSIVDNSGLQGLDKMDALLSLISEEQQKQLSEKVKDKIDKLKIDYADALAKSEDTSSIINSTKNIVSKIIENEAFEHGWSPEYIIQEAKKQLEEYLMRAGVKPVPVTDMLADFCRELNGMAINAIKEGSKQNGENRFYQGEHTRRVSLSTKVRMPRIVNETGVTAQDVDDARRDLQTPPQQQGNSTAQNTEDKQSSTDDDTDGITN